MVTSQIKNIVTIGASAGGIFATAELLKSFNDRIDAAVFVVIHVSRKSTTEIIKRYLQKQSLLPCVVANDGDTIQNRMVYLAPADYQMMLVDGTISVKKGALENHWRPSIDVLFRSAAAAYGSCVTGVILTGLMDDGTSGMYAIKRCGGVCIVQDPAEAEFAEMPNNVLRNMKVDYEVSLHEIGYILSDLYSRRECNPSVVPEDVKLEAEITVRMGSSLEELKKIAEPTTFTCPDCGGVLSKVESDVIPRYRCFTGHSYTLDALKNLQIDRVEDSLWVAIRLMEERKHLLESLNSNSQNIAIERTEQISIHIERLKKMLLELGKNAL